MTNVRMVNPIMETPPITADATATKAVTEMTVGTIAPFVAAQQGECDPFQQTRLGNHRDKEG